MVEYLHSAIGELEVPFQPRWLQIFIVTRVNATTNIFLFSFIFLNFTGLMSEQAINHCVIRYSKPVSLYEFEPFMIKHLSDSQYSDISISGAQFVLHIYSSNLGITIATIPSSTTDIFKLLPMVINNSNHPKRTQNGNVCHHHSLTLLP